ncbi:rod shape-determining protein MreC [Nonomuraea soli]|uniref:Cell shape-determining protein MreC n=1 Tax=Nonomuraea soli TaxID=1032476 RepID=A0A7W0CTA1_9ACTN|nr:rod shape-determining protein MreC [Nonomuraea soli]MBA2896938.1 rod shape-determining protein MreC [Nonomuraea soli]
MRDTRRARLILGLLLTAALVILTIDHRTGQDSPLGPLRGMGAAVFGTAEQFGGAVGRPVASFFSAMAGAPGAQDRIKRLEEENARLRAGLSASALDRKRSQELRSMLGLSGLGGYTVVSANVVARRGHPGFEDAVEIDAGTDDGVRTDMTVLNGYGLIGRVVQAGTTTSTVVLLSDPASSAGARLEGGNEIGVVSGVGHGGKLVRFRLLDSTAPLAPGLRLVSFGSQKAAPYVSGVPIGVIERVEATPGELTRIAYARPFVDLTSLDVVGVVVKAPKRDPRDAVLPVLQGER